MQTLTPPRRGNFSTGESKNRYAVPTAELLRRSIAIERVKAATGAHYGFAPAQLAKGCRQRRLALARHVAMYLCRQIPGLSFPAIAFAFRCKNHGSVMHASFRVSELLNMPGNTIATDLVAIRTRVRAAELEDARKGGKR